MPNDLSQWQSPIQQTKVQKERTVPSKEREKTFLECSETSFEGEIKKEEFLIDV